MFRSEKAKVPESAEIEYSFDDGESSWFAVLAEKVWTGLRFLVLIALASAAVVAALLYLTARE